MSPIPLDFVAPYDYVHALLPETVLSVVAMTVLLVDVFQRGREGGPSSPLVRRLAVGGILLTMAANFYLFRLEAAGPGGMVAVDGFRAASNFLILGGTLLAVLFSLDYLRRESLGEGEFHSLVLLSAVGMMFLAGAQNLILTFLGLEVMSLAAYVLTAYNRRDPRSSEAGLKYFLFGAFASAFFIYGIALLYGATGTVHLPELVPAAVAGLEAGSALLVLGLGLLVVGFAFKVAAVPFHMWAPDAYHGAPTPATGFMAATVKAAAFLALLRVVTVGLEGTQAVWGGIVWGLAVLTMVIPNFVALVQDDVKRMLAYSSVAHAGYVLVGVAAGGELGTAAAFYYLVVYTLMTLGAFGVVYVVAGRGDRRSNLSDFAGLGWSRPLLGGVMLLFLLSLAGFPPTGGFVAKLFLLQAALEGGLVVLAVVLVLTSLVSYYYYLRVAWKMYFEEAPEAAVAPGATGGAFRFAAAFCAVGVLLTGILPGGAIEGAREASRTLEVPVMAPAEPEASVPDGTPVSAAPVAMPAATLEPGTTVAPGTTVDLSSTARLRITERETP